MANKNRDQTLKIYIHKILPILGFAMDCYYFTKSEQERPYASNIIFNDVININLKPVSFETKEYMNNRVIKMRYSITSLTKEQENKLITDMSNLGFIYVGHEEYLEDLTKK